jgi:hypothetical protein
VESILAAKNEVKLPAGVGGLPRTVLSARTGVVPCSGT